MTASERNQRFTSSPQALFRVASEVVLVCQANAEPGKNWQLDGLSAHQDAHERGEAK